MMSRFGVIVDGYSTGAGLAKAFESEGITCLHIQSQRTIPKVYAHTYKPDHYERHFVFDGDVTELTEQLKPYQLEFIIPGAECGIELADHLSEALELSSSNGSALSASRRDKYLMWQQVKAKGIQVIPSLLAQTLEEAVEWASHQAKWPLVAKPLRSAGGEGVKICASISEVVAAYTDIMSTQINMLGFQNQAVLLQHYIVGEEYVVNTVSYAGDHKLCELWNYARYSRPYGRQIYDVAKVVNFDVAKHEAVVNYAINIIEALGIQYGPAHVEIIKNEEGCFLIEVGARLMGANLPFALLTRCITTPQALYTVLAYANPVEFKKKITSPYRVTYPLEAVFMISNHAGIIKEITCIDEIRSLTSFCDMKLAVKEGDILKETIDYQTSPGMIYLSHENPVVIESDKRKIREIEAKMFALTPVEETQKAVEA